MPLPPHTTTAFASAFALGGVIPALSCTQDAEDQSIKPHCPKLSWMAEEVENPAPSGKSLKEKARRL